jgi:hypothetical protein
MLEQNLTTLLSRAAEAPEYDIRVVTNEEQCRQGLRSDFKMLYCPSTR